MAAIDSINNVPPHLLGSTEWPTRENTSVSTTQQQVHGKANQAGSQDTQTINAAIREQRRASQTQNPNSPANLRKAQAAAQPPLPKNVSQKAKAATQVLNRYRIGYKNDWDVPEAVTRSQTLIEAAIQNKQPIELCLPAFPFKSSNRSHKVLGPLPDEAERVSLLYLNGLCQSIKESSEADCYLTIISDGISYNDLLSVSDAEVWNYGQSLRQMANEYGCHNIRFARMHDLLGPDYAVSGTITRAQYLDMVPKYREGLEKYLPAGFDAADQIANHPDTAKTYSGYKKFLQTERDVELGRSRSDKENAVIAKKMLARGKAFAEAIRANYQHAVRLSIHPSGDVDKISISLLPQENEVTMTPWHGAVIRKIDGTIIMSHAYNVSAFQYDLVYEQDRPTHFRERSELFDWEEKKVQFEYQYPTGIIVRPSTSESYGLYTIDMQKVRRLAEQCSPVILRGFKDTLDRRRFIAKAYDLGDVQPWKSGIIQEVKDEANKDPTSNSVVSSEAMPMHYDGMFKLITVKDETTGLEKQVSDAPRFQYFVSQTVSAPGDGYTLFASSARFSKYLPQSYDISKMSKIRWSVHSNGYFDHDVVKLNLIVPHPTLGTPCVRWHQPWPKWRTAYGWADIKIENGSQSIAPLVDSVLFDRRVCLYFAWQKGDILVSDNFSMLHTRTAFKGESGREIWRIHVN